LLFATGWVGARARPANMEVKPIDGSANPYLVLGSVIAAGIEGLERRLELPPETVEDPLALSDRERRRRRIRQLPSSLPEAIKELEGSDVLRTAMGDMLFGAFLATRRGEAERFAEGDPADVIRAHRWRY
jgi:glutamine synthetase